jgi:hypothetical protein
LARYPAKSVSGIPFHFNAVPAPGKIWAGSDPIMMQAMRLGDLDIVFGFIVQKGGKRCRLLFIKIWKLLSPFLSNEPGSD